MDKTGFGLPLRVDIASGQALEPTGLDPYSLRWVQGAASTVPVRTRRRYAEQIADLREKLDLLRSKRAKDTDVPIFGPRLRPAGFSAMQNRPLPADGNPFGWERSH